MEIESYGAWDDVLPEDYLELPDGSVVKNLMGLIDMLKRISKEDFLLHVSGENNDFAYWIMDAYGDEELSEKIRKARTRKRIIAVLHDAVKNSERYSSKKIRAPGRKKGILKILREGGNGL